MLSLSLKYNLKNAYIARAAVTSQKQFSHIVKRLIDQAKKTGKDVRKFVYNPKDKSFKMLMVSIFDSGRISLGFYNTEVKVYSALEEYFIHPKLLSNIDIWFEGSASTPLQKCYSLFKLL